METRCTNCGSPITLDEATRGVCSSCNAVLPHVMRAQQQAMAFQTMQGAPGMRALPMQAVPHAPKAQRSPMVLVPVMAGVMVVLGAAAVMVLLIAGPMTPSATPKATTKVGTGLAIRACREKSSMRSKESAAAVAYSVKNDTAVTMSVSWIDTNGATTFYRQLGPGESYVQPSYVTHPWVVDDEKGICQGLFVAERSGPFTVFLSAVRDAR